jgi:hypothetical protein
MLGSRPFPSNDSGRERGDTAWSPYNPRIAQAVEPVSLRLVFPARRAADSVHADIKAATLIITQDACKAIWDEQSVDSFSVGTGGLDSFATGSSTAPASASFLATIGPTTPTRAEDTGNQSPKGAWSACKGAAGPTEPPLGPESIQLDSSEDRPPLTGLQRINIRWKGKDCFSRPEAQESRNGS